MNTWRSLGDYLGFVLVGSAWLLAPLGLLYLVGWYVDDSQSAASVIYWATICYGVVAGLFFALMAWCFFTTKDSQRFAQDLGVTLSFGMMVPFFLLILVIVIALFLKWFF